MVSALRPTHVVCMFKFEIAILPTPRCISIVCSSCWRRSRRDGDPFTDGDPTRAADVLNNSWGCPEIEGCDPNALLPAADNLRDAGIFVVVSTGNDGPNCSTVNAPLSLYDSVFSVGAIDQFGNMADFSSRGPVIVDGSRTHQTRYRRTGCGYILILPGGTYGSPAARPWRDRTSWAWWRCCGQRIQVSSAILTARNRFIIDTAQPYTGNTSIGCFDGDIPNAAYGYGIVDVYAAVKEAWGNKIIDILQGQVFRG